MSDPNEDVKRRLLEATAGACTCMTKTPAVEFHQPQCTYRVLHDAVSVIGMLQSSLEARGPVALFPIQLERGAAPHPPRIPWRIAELAYSVYAARYGRDQSLFRLAQRGGFAPSEMDMFLPDWRERCEAIARHDETLARVEAAIQKRVEQYCSDPEIGSTESDTGAYVFHRRESESFVEALDEIIELVQHMRKEGACENRADG